MRNISDNLLRPTNTWQGFHCASEFQDWVCRQRFDDDVLHFVPPTPASTDQARITSQSESAYEQGVEAYKRKDYPEAVVQWRQAVAQGNRLALNNLGYLAYYGLGMQAAPSFAVDLWRKGAALRGVNDGQPWEQMSCACILPTLQLWTLC